MNKNLLIAVAVVILGGVFLVAINLAHKSTPENKTPATPTVAPTPTPKQLTVALNAQSKSGQTGIAVLTEVNGKVTVDLTLAGEAATADEPAHIHVGSCPTPGAVKFPLTDVVDGKSTTTLPSTITSLDDLVKLMPLAVNVHKSAAQIGVYVACGDISATPSGAMMPSGAMSPTGMMHASPTSVMMHSTVAPTSKTGY